MGQGGKNAPEGRMPDVQSDIQLTSNKMRSMSAHMYGALRQGYGAVV